MAKTKFDFNAAYKANKENHAIAEAKMVAGLPLSTPVEEPEKKEEPALAKAAEKKPAAAKKPVQKEAAEKKPAKATKAPSAKASVNKPEPASGKKAGRPKADERSDEETVLRSFNITAKEIKAIDFYCMKNGCAKTTIVRDALDEFFEKRGIYAEMEKLGF